MKLSVFTLTLAFCLLFTVNLFAQFPPPPPPADSANTGKTVFSKVEVEAAYPGGDNAWRNFLYKNLNRNTPTDNNAPNGKYTVIVKFIVSKDGTIKDVVGETNLGYGMEAEVIRLIKKSGIWTPAMQNGKPVNAYRRQPVTFILEEDNFIIGTKTPYTLFTGTDNKLDVTIKRVKNSDITLTITKGTIITKSDDNDQFFAQVSETGRVVISAYLKKNNKLLGQASFEVK